MNVGQFYLLMNLDAMTESNVTKLADVLGLERTTVVRNLKPLLADGFVADISGDNNRDRKIIVTAKGKTTLTKAIPLWKKTQREVYSVIGAENINMFQDVMTRLQQL
ncbi:MAG: MarR family winged helix-turn-helix transcriptional regulator [Desulfovibrionaceae bacterium]|nr:MarR family winged helix-turn-helix transcriptional regulator [Desulfovibrionaceae bacterium]